MYIWTQIYRHTEKCAHADTHRDTEKRHTHTHTPPFRAEISTQNKFKTFTKQIQTSKGDFPQLNLQYYQQNRFILRQATQYINSPLPLKCFYQIRQLLFNLLFSELALGSECTQWSDLRFPTQLSNVLLLPVCI